MDKTRIKYTFNVLAKYFLIFALISFLGWLWETVYLWVVCDKFLDRGFMILPFCPIYGTTVLAVYFLMGTPNEKRGILSKVDVFEVRCTMYLLIAFIAPTLAELFVGKFFTEVLNISLWDYSYLPYNTDGYISLPISIIWAIAIFLFMLFLFDKIKNAIWKIPHKAAITLALSLSLAMAIDSAVCFLRVI